MKETIEYYYSLNIKEINVKDDNYYFTYNNFLYNFIHFNRSESELNELLLCTSELIKKGIKAHEFILNRENSFLTKIEELNYILIKMENNDEKYEVIDMINFNRKFKLLDNKSKLYRNNWNELWSAKIDYLEKQLMELKPDFIVKYSIDYYIGLAENAIYYINLINAKYKKSGLDEIVLSRKRVYYPNKHFNYFNPLTFVFDLEVRDIAEYIKSVFFADENALLELETFLKIRKLTVYSYNMLFARLLYPSYYFDVYENVVNKNMDSQKLLKIINKATDYQQFIKKAYLEISKYALLEKIVWIIGEH